MTKTLNQFKTALFMGGLFGFVLFVGYAVGREQGLKMALILGFLMNGFVFFFSDKLAIMSMRGKQVTDQDAPELVGMVRRLADHAQLPMPRVYICPQDAPNAFATGRSPKHAAVAVTQGAMRLLNDKELEGVMAHELAHVKNRDTLISTIAASVAGVLGYLQWMFILGGGGDRERLHPGLQLALVFLAPIMAAIIQAAVSRSREFIADHDGAVIAGSPDGLISALQKLENHGRQIPMAVESASKNHMFIVPPMNAGMGRSALKWFSTHPDTSDRIAKLRELDSSMALHPSRY